MFAIGEFDNTNNTDLNVVIIENSGLKLLGMSFTSRTWLGDLSIHKHNFGKHCCMTAWLACIT